MATLPTTTQTQSTTPAVTTSSSGLSSSSSSSAGALSSDQVGTYWIQAGGNPQAVDMAIAVADASSGLNPSVKRTNPDGTTSIGLWLIPSNGTPPGSTDPLANARAAVQLSNNGTDWSQWCVTWSDNNCGLNAGTYLGDGANALGALSSNNGEFNVAGATPTGTNNPASTAASSTPTAATPSSSISKFLIPGVLIAAVVAVFIMTRRKTNENGTGGEGKPWDAAEISALSGDESDTALAARLGRSRHAIHVKRSRTTADQNYTH